MGRTIIIGDVHGCRAELEDILWKVGHGSSDRLYFVGDLIARGPDSQGVVHLVRKLGGVVVRGNHEDKILQWYHAFKAGLDAGSLSGTHRQVARSLSRADWQFLAQTPLWVDLPDHQLRLVHAGVLPGIPMEFQARRTLLTVRSLSSFGEPLERAGQVPWASRYLGPPHVVFGHHAQPAPQIHPFATGIDTGCVYGGAMTAVVLHDGEPMPASVADRPAVLVSMPARRRWFRGR